MENNRNYHGSDGYMLETSGALHLLFADDLADFTAFDTTLDAAFGTAWLAKITAGYQVDRHSQLKNNLGIKTEIVLETMDKCRKKYKEVKFFAQKAFPDSPNHVEKFGTDTYSDIRVSQSRMVAFMDEMHKACTLYSVEVLAVGMQQTQIDEILTFRDNLMTANFNQEWYAKELQSLTVVRITTLNSCYKDTRLIIDAAMVVFADSPVRKQLYVYNPSSVSSVSTEVVLRNINEGITEMLHTMPYDSERQIVLDNRGPAIVSFYLADTEGAISLQRDVMPGEIVTVTADELGVNGDNLYAEIQLGSGPFAEVEVEIYL